MKTKTRESGTERERTLSSLFHRVSPGKCLALIFMFRAITWATGCSSGPADGTLGGKCKDDGCELTCTDGSVCDQSEDVCVSSSSVGGGGNSSVPPVFGPSTVEGCGENDTGACEGDEYQFTCTDGYAPPGEYSCRVVATGTYCCTAVDACVTEACDASGPTDDAGEDVVDAATLDGGDE